MQSHVLLASLWIKLEDRNDTANLLREIVGQHTSDLLDLDNLFQADVQPALRSIYWIKVVFDIQRSYQQAAAYPNVPGLLPSELIYTTLLHVLDVHSKIFANNKDTIRTGHRLLVAHAFLSGFRLLTLLHEQLEPRKLLRLQKALQIVSKDGCHLSATEEFIFSVLAPAALTISSSSELQSGNAYSLSLRQMGLPTFPEGLYPLCLRPGKMIATCFAHICERDRTWMTWYWTLFDSIWASESAILQYNVDHGNEGEEPGSPVSPRAVSPADIRTQLQNGRRNLLLALFRPACAADLVPDACILDSLRATVVEWWLDGIFSDASTPNLVSEKHALEIRFSLDAFATWLKERKLSITPVVSCMKCSPSPLKSVPMAIHGSERSNSIFFHKGSTQIFRGRSAGAENIDRLDTPLSSDGTSATPTTTTSGSLSSSTAGANRRRSSPPLHTRLTPMTSFNSYFSSSTGEETPSTSTSPKVKRGKTLRHVLTSSKDKEKKQTEVCKPSSFCFSSAGTHLLLWGGNLQGFLRIQTPLDAEERVNDGTKWVLPAIKQVVGGTDRCIVLASHQSQFRLISFIANKPLPEAETTLDMTLRHHTDCCMVMSRNDKFVALAVNDGIRLYQTSAGHIRRIQLHEQLNLYQHLAQERRLLQGPAGRSLSSREAAREAQHQSSVVEKRLSFSPSGDRLVIATHLADQHVYVDVYKTDTEPCTPISPQPRCFQLPPFTANDGGLTNIFFSDVKQCAQVCTLLAKDHPNMLYFWGSTSDLMTDEALSSKIVQAAQGPDSSLVAATGLTELVHLVANESGTMVSRRLKRCPSKLPPNVFKTGNLALAVPRSNTAFAFWIKDTKLQLRKMDIGQNTDSYIDFDVRQLVDRLQNELVDPVVLSSTVVPDFGEPSLLHSDSSLRPLAELPGSLLPIAELAGTSHDTAD